MRILLKGFIADGSGKEPSRGALLFENGKIIALEKDITGTSAADKIYSFDDEIISPGFIDVHGHSDLSLMSAPSAFSKRSQGVTTEISGNCGLSAYPVTEKNLYHLKELYSNYPAQINWQNHASYHRQLSAKNPALRMYTLCGHNTLRAAVAGYEKRSLSASETKQMCAMLEAELNSGALGLSTGLLYTPGCFASDDELLELMKILAANDCVYATHLKSEGDQLLESLTATLELAREAGLKRVQISHFKTAGKKNWHKLGEALELFEYYRSCGIDVHIDRYPYTESQTMLSVALPPPWSETGDVELKKQLSLPGECEKLLAELRIYRDENYWQNIRLTATAHPHWHHYCGRKICDISNDPAALTVELLAYDAPSAMMSASVMSEENMKRILALPYCCCGSDGNAVPQDMPFGTVHPRSFGAAAKFMRLLLDSSAGIGEACRRMSGMPAQFFKLQETGILKPGFRADITVFNPETVNSTADFTNPSVPASGIIMSFSGLEQ